MGQRNVERFIDPSAVPFIVAMPFTVTDGDEPDGVEVLSGIISATEDFYGFVVRSTGSAAFTYLLLDGEDLPLSNIPIDGLSVTNEEIVRNLGESGRLVPFFVPKGEEITLTLHKTGQGSATGTIEVRGVKIKG